MKYDFDTVVKRDNVPYSYSLKWASKGKAGEMIKGFVGADEIPEDRLCFFTADMDFKCPPEVIEAMVKTAEHGIYGYSAPGEEYYQAICHWFKTRFDWEIDPEDIYPGTSGTHKLMADCVRDFTQPGEGVVLFLPSYGYHGDVDALGRKYVGVPMICTDGYYTVDFDALEAACADPNNTMMFMIQPHNPTGRVFTEEEIKKIGDICRRNNVILVSDEVHIDIARAGQKVLPVMKVLGTKGVITATAINKTFNVAGLAMSNLIVVDPELKAKLSYGKFVSASPFGISAVIAAYTKGAAWVDALNEYLDKILDYAVERIHNDLPKITLRKPEGTYVLWLDCSGLGLSDEELHKRLGRAHVLVSNGTGFDDPKGKQMIRICLTAPMCQVIDMCDRLKEAFKDC